MVGTIKCVKAKGFGFIRPDDGTADVFFHASKVSGIKFDELKEGQAVEYDAVLNEQGANALAVYPKN